MKEIKLTQGKVAMVDDEDFEYLSQWRWYANKIGRTFYAVRTSARKAYLMHRVILDLSDRKILADHKDHNGLNNCRINLRRSDKSQNNANGSSAKNSQSKYLGVTWRKDTKKWQAQITRDKKNNNLGSYINEEDAARAYNEAAIKIHGEFANLNIIQNVS